MNLRLLVNRITPQPCDGPERTEHLTWIWTDLGQIAPQALLTILDRRFSSLNLGRNQSVFPSVISLSVFDNVLDAPA